MPAAPRDPAPWRIAIDTGGTFTDAIALSPAGELRTAKVLSSGALRATVIDAAGDLLRIEQRWGERGAPSGFIDGARLRIAGQPGEWTILGFDAAASTIRLDRTAPPLAPGAALEIRTGEDAPALAIRLLTHTPAGAEPPPRQVRLSTTRATNALLERRGARVGVILNEGHGDLLAIGDQRRPELFALAIRKPEPWHELTVEVSARLGASGAELAPVTPDEVARAAERLRAAGIESVAIALLHADINPAHEIEIERLLRAAGFASVTRSSALAPRLGLLARAQTATIDAYIGPVLHAYLVGAMGRSAAAAPRAGEPASPLRIMTSAGGLSLPERFHATEGLLSGPAGGVAGALAAGRAEGATRLISFDMGGTSTDVARLDDGFEYRFEQRIEGATVLAPAIAIETVAAGGGSICALEHGRLSVGPRSAGADPGPACYGAGGPLTLTDVNLLLGRIDPGSLPIPIDPAPAEARLAELAAAIERETGAAPVRAALLQGLIDIADERMAGAIRSVSSRRGFDPADYTLVAFGGAGGLHACGVAARLGITRIIVPARAGLLSAAGVASAAVEEFAERQILRPLAEVAPELESIATELAAQAGGAGGAAGGGMGVSPVRTSPQDSVASPPPATVPDPPRPPEGALSLAPGEAQRSPGSASPLIAGAPDGAKVASDALLHDGTHHRLISLRMLGQESTIDLDWPQGAPTTTLPHRFAEAHERRYGVAPDLARIEAVSLRVIVRDTSSAWPPGPPAPQADSGADRAAAEMSEASGASARAVCVQRAALAPGATLRGPALILEPTATTWLAEGWTLSVTEHGALSLTFDQDGSTRKLRSARSADLPASDDRVAQELFTTRLEAIAEDMGETLRRSALSTNIRQRLDYSCAILDGEAELIISAPHVPVHLGALGECVRRVRERIVIGPGDIIITNHPAYGGSHLPDITLIAGVFADGEPAPVACIACRAHHAEIGGIAPGSMPAGATTLAEEGVIIEPMCLARAGRFDWPAIEALLQGAQYPTRAPEENLADLRAQVAAIRRGEQGTAALAEAIGPGAFARRAETIKATAESLLRARLAPLRLPPGVRTAERLLDDGSPIRVRIGATAAGLTIDFTGSAPEHPGSFNATPAIVRSCLIYVLRLLVNEPIPLNEGLMRAIDLRLPHGMLNPHFGGIALPGDAEQAGAVEPPGASAPPGAVRMPIARKGDATAPAVSAGNVETSQAIVDALIEAFALAAHSQGTMNNLAFGPVEGGEPGAFPSFYETLGGGAGATPPPRAAPGASAVHTHMTNTALTDPEVIERRYPVRVERMAIRRGSGGAAGPGGHPGGDGIDRRLRFLAQGGAAVSLVTQRRTSGPSGLFGGGAGAAGRQWLEPAAGQPRPLPSVAAVTVGPGDLLVLQTPGGGGCGRAPE